MDDGLAKVRASWQLFANVLYVSHLDNAPGSVPPSVWDLFLLTYQFGLFHMLISCPAP